jgi:hypothetical protein
LRSAKVVCASSMTERRIPASLPPARREPFRFGRNSVKPVRIRSKRRDCA